jgi:hypothetical protein
VARARVADGLVNVALAGAGLATLVLLYGLAARTFVPRTGALQTESEAAPGGDVIQVEVLNGAGELGIAATGTRFLRARGFDVVYQGNHEPVIQTRIVDRIGDPEPARRVAASLGFDVDRVSSEPDPTRDVDVSVILGPDHAGLRPYSRPNAGS